MTCRQAQLSGDAKAIQLLKPSQVSKNLGLFVGLDSYSDMNMLQLRDRMEDWTKRVKNGALTTCSL